MKTVSLSTPVEFQFRLRDGRIWSTNDACMFSTSFFASGGSREIMPLALHYLRRTCTRLCQAEGELEQTQFLLGHESVQTTERYIGCRQKFRERSMIGFESRSQIPHDNPVYHAHAPSIPAPSAGVLPSLLLEAGRFTPSTVLPSTALRSQR